MTKIYDEFKKNQQKQQTVSSHVEPVVSCDSYAHKGINHGSTVVVCNNRPEFEFVTAWLDDNGKNIPYLCKPSKYPFCISTKDGGWTDLMDRALYYKPFIEFILDIKSN